MDEYNPMNYSCEPEEEPKVEPQPQYEPYSYSPQPQPPKKKKDRTFLKLAALVLVVALLGSVGGALLTGAIGAIGKDRQESMQAEDEVPGLPEEEPTPETPDAPADEQDAPDYERVNAPLPSQLESYSTGKKLTPTQVYELTVNSVVGISTESTTNVFGQEAVAASSGSGFIISEDGYVITNAHVVSGANSITVELFNGDSFEAQLAGASTDFDIAVLKISAKGLPAVGVGDSDTLKVGEEVVAIGNPLGELTFTMTNGILSALDREINTDGNPQSMLQTNAAINSGNSGGPLFDMDGNVIGVTTAKYSGSTATGTTIEGLGFAIPINDALKVAYDLVEYGYVRDQAYLGVTVKTLTEDMSAYYSLPVGPRVEAVVPGSCAEKAGIQVGDIIVSFNGIEVENNAALLAALKKVKAGETVPMTLFRAGTDVEITITLDERPSEEILDAQVKEYESQQQEVFPYDEEGGYFYEYPGDDFFGFGD